MPISGLMELDPISRCWLNDKLRLSADDIQRYSPQRLIGDGAPLLVTVGGDELPALIRHSREYASACREAGQAVRLVELAGCHHFAVLDDLARVDGEHVQALLEHLTP
jgi:acetyl esterase/lipase